MFIHEQQEALALVKREELKSKPVVLVVHVSQNRTDSERENSVRTQRWPGISELMLSEEEQLEHLLQ